LWIHTQFMRHMPKALTFQAHENSPPFYLLRIAGDCGGRSVFLSADLAKETLAAGRIPSGPDLSVSCFAIRTLEHGSTYFQAFPGIIKNLIPF
jgi:hypothetical protein